MVMQNRAFPILLLVVGMLALAGLACTSDQEWIIPRTETPVPTETPIPLDADALYAIGDQVVITTNTFSIQMLRQPAPDSPNNRLLGGSCFKDTTVEVLEIGQDSDGNVYYKVECSLEGWLAEANLTPAED